MGLFGFLSATRSDAERLARYRENRQVLMELNSRLVHNLAGDSVQVGAARLGLARGRTLVLDAEEHLCVLMDYCINHVRTRGMTAIESFVQSQGPSCNAREQELLQVMLASRYTLVAIEQVVRGVGCQVRDLFKDELRLLVDIGMSTTAKQGLIIGSQLLDFGDYVTTTGASLPVGLVSPAEIGQWQSRLNQGVENESADPAPIIRSLLKGEGATRIRYQEVESHSASGNVLRRIDSREPDVRPPFIAHRVDNRRCECGSGKMFKNCCGKRQHSSK